MDSYCLATGKTAFSKLFSTNMVKQKPIKTISEPLEWTAPPVTTHNGISGVNGTDIKLALSIGVPKMTLSAR